MKSRFTASRSSMIRVLFGVKPAIDATTDSNEKEWITLFYQRFQSENWRKRRQLGQVRAHAALKSSPSMFDTCRRSNCKWWCFGWKEHKKATFVALARCKHSMVMAKSSTSIYLRKRKRQVWWSLTW
jgi:hypothetical protein